MKRVVLLEATVALTYVVIDDDGAVQKASAQPITVAAADWPVFPAFTEQERAAREAELNAPDA